MNDDHTITVFDSYTERHIREADWGEVGRLVWPSEAFERAYWEVPPVVDWETAQHILDHVDDWTLGSEGRATLYLDDEVVEADAGEVDAKQPPKAALAVFRAYAVLLKRLVEEVPA